MKLISYPSHCLLCLVFLACSNVGSFSAENGDITELVVARQAECDRSVKRPRTVGDVLADGSSWPPEKTLQLANGGNVDAMIAIADCLWDRELTMKTDGKSKWVDLDFDRWFKVRDRLDSKAIVWYEKAIKLNSIAAMRLLAENYLERYNTRGSSFSADRDRAISLYKKAAVSGDIASIRVLYNAYKEGRYVVQDYRQVYDYMNKAAEIGDADTQYLLGVFLSEQKGFPADLVNAYKWFILANYLGRRNDKKDEIQERMTSQQVLRGQALARDWLARRGLEP